MHRLDVHSSPWSMIPAVVPFLLLAAQPGCGSDPGQTAAPGQKLTRVTLAITDPADGLRTREAEIAVAGLVEGAAPGDPIEVAGVVVPVERERFFVPALPLAEGDNLLQALHRPSGAASEPVTVLRDSTPPRLAITEPPVGTLQQEPSCPVTMEVTASDPSGVDSLLLAGMPFTGKEPGPYRRELSLGSGLHALVAEAVDMLGNRAEDSVHVLCGPFASPDDPQQGALRAFLGNDALVPIASTIASALDRLDLTALAVAQNPLFESGGFTLLARSITLAPGTQLALRAGQGTLSASLVLGAVQIEVELLGKARMFGTLAAEGAHLQGELRLRLAEDGRSLAAGFGELQVDLQGLRIGVDEQDDLLEALSCCRDSIERSLEGKLADLLADAVPGLIADGFTRVLEPLPLEVLERSLELSLQPEEIDVSPLGVALGLGVQLRLQSAPTLLASPGYPATPGAPHALSPTGGLLIAASDDLLNLMLHEVWRSAGLELIIDQAFLDRNRIELDLVAGFLGSLLDGLVPAVDPEEPVVLRTRAPLPPLVRIEPGDDRMPLGLTLPDLLVEVVLPGPPERLLLRMAVSLKVRAEAVVEAGNLKLRIGELEIDCHAAGGEASEQARQVVVPAVRAIVDSVRPLLDTLVAHLPLPSLAGLTIEKLRLTGEGQGSYLALWISLR